MTMQAWLQRAAIDNDARPSPSEAESVDFREARKRIRRLEQEVEVLRRAAAYLWPTNRPGKLYPGARELAAERIPVAVTCRVLTLARQPYDRWLIDPTTDTEVVEVCTANALFDAHRDDLKFGYRLVADEARDVGQTMDDRTAWRICREKTWWSAFGKKRGRNDK